MRVPLSASVFAEPAAEAARPDPRAEAGPEAWTEARPDARAEAGPEAWTEAGPEARTEPRTDPHASLMTEPEDEPLADYDTWRAPSAAPPLWDSPSDQGPHDGGYPSGGNETLLLEPELPGTWRPGTRRGRVSRRTATIAVPVIVLVAVAVLALALLTGHGPKFGPLASSQQPNPATNQGTTAQSALTIGMYPGQQQRGVFQTVNRVVASGNTIVTMGSQTSDGVVRQQFFVSVNGGASWRLAPVNAPRRRPGPARASGRPAGRRSRRLAGRRPAGHLDQPERPVLDARVHPGHHPDAEWRRDVGAEQHVRRVPGRWRRRHRKPHDAGRDLDLP